MENPLANDNKVEISFDPTLFIFLGTTSGKVGWRLKKLFNDAYGEIPIVKFLWMDIQSIPEQQSARVFDKNRERIELSGSNPSTVTENLDNHPFIKAWWPAVSPPPGLLNGGGGSPQQMRLVGRLMYFSKFNDIIYSRLTSALNSLKLIQRQRETEAIENNKFRFTVNDNSINVCLIFSPCGGTGSSMAFDLAYLCRKILENNNPKIISMMMAPSVFLQEIKPQKVVERKKALANAYAYFRENNYLLENPEWNVRYSNEVNVSMKKVPFDLQYVVGIENAKGQRLSSLDDVANMMAQALFLNSGISLQAGVAQTVSNVNGTSEEFQGKLSPFSSLAAASLIFPQERLRDYCASKYAQKIVREGLLTANEESVVTRTAALILSRNNLLDKDLINGLQTVNTIPYIHEQELKNAVDVARAVSIVENQYMEVQLMVKDREKAIENNYQTLLLKAKAALVSEALQSIRQYGLSTTLGVLERLIDQTPLRQPAQVITSFSQILGLINQNGISPEDFKREQNEYEISKQALKNLDDGFEDKLERTIAKKGWERKLKAAKESVIKEMKDAVDSQLIKSAQDQARKLLSELFGELSKIISDLKVAKTNIEQTLLPLEENAAHLLRPTSNAAEVYEFRREVEINFDVYYQSFISNISGVNDFSFIPATLTETGKFCEWVKLNFDLAIREFAGSLFNPLIEDLSLLSVIRDIAHAKGIEPKKYLEHEILTTFSYCEPFFKYNTDIGVTAPTMEKLLGIEDASDEIITNDIQERFNVITTGIKDRIDFLVLEHGLPIHVLDDMEACRQMYELVLIPRKGKDRPDDPLHVLPEVYKSTDDVSPDKEGESKQWFAIGFAFNYIIHTGRNYYLDMTKDYQKTKARPGKEFMLGISRTDAKKAFSKNTDFVRQVEEAVDKEVSQMGNASAIKYIDAAVQAYLDKIASLSNQGETSLVEQYRQELADLRKYQDSLKS